MREWTDDGRTATDQTEPRQRDGLTHRSPPSASCSLSLRTDNSIPPLHSFAMMRLSVPSAAAAATRSALVQPTAAAAAASSARRGMATGKDISFGVSASRTATGGGE